MLLQTILGTNSTQNGKKQPHGVGSQKQAASLEPSRAGCKK
ncbi:hypothetical protein YPPY15_3615 [Yersinia pestis PY-15]|uniref:Uncharacterized protein n=1 Tax=Yersinia pestis PY-08 TaxID=992134 RepID=A0AB72ZFJ6_YERPE|nr:hypothetical protein YP516_0969 [Yersinia pestis Nepal516]EIR15197.1 hypothetical protein YPPY08_3670 [Yersinia pestis PY-08]EIR30803.1 hypothetical protein YPPY12_3803 [Yersinia pestis PY-12]EIR44517.1 hypothetical protein YPPY15_3615 [Yersinia pestis PY-15]EIS14834.1 hypothetical protein YPPY52_3704 [Yersinia pestis PY-52]